MSGCPGYSRFLLENKSVTFSGLLIALRILDLDFKDNQFATLNRYWLFPESMIFISPHIFTFFIAKLVLVLTC